MRVRTAFVILTLVASAGAGAQVASPDAPRRFGERGVFVPSGGYKRTVELLRFERMVQAASARAAAPARRPTALAGTRDLPVVLVAFKNRPPTFTQAEYVRRLFSEPVTDGSSPAKTVSQYYRDVSAGRFNVRGTVLGWYVLKNDDTVYENNEFDSGGAIVRLNNGSGKPFGDLLEEALTRADKTIDFGAYDNDGPDGRPNSGDDDGKVDTVLLIHSEAGGECGGDDQTNIWSHSWHYSEPKYGHTGPFETRAIRKDEHGNPRLKADGSPEHIVIEDYTIQPGLACHQENMPSRIVDIGVICHEYGHALGLPDLYDRTPDGNPDSSGVGDYCVMSGGAYGGDDFQPDLPVFMSAWARAYLGWGSLAPIQSGSITFEPAILRGRSYVFDVSGTDGKEYFLVEYRDKFATPPLGQVNWDAGLPNSGLAIWHVDEHVGEKSRSWPFAPPDEGQNDAPSLPLPGGTGFTTPHSLVSLIQADRLLELEKGKNRFGSGDLWTDAHDFHDDPTFVAGARGYDSRATGLRLNNINLASGTMSAATSEMQVAALHVAPPAVVAAEQAPSLSRPSAPPVQHVQLAKEAAIHVDRAELDRAIDKLMTGNQSDEVRIQLAPDAKSIRSVTGLSVPKRGDPASAAEQLFLKDVPQLTGGVALSPRKTLDGTVKFDQTLDVQGEKLPLFERGAVAHFGGKYLKAITTNIIDPSRVAVTGDHAAMTVEEAKARVAGLLKVPATKILSAREGVHLIDDDPTKARVAYEVLIDAGKERAPIKVVLDETSREVLDIK